MAASGGDTGQQDALVEFFLRETGETLHIVVEYTADDHELRYVAEGERPRLANLFGGLEEFMDQFREEARRKAQWEQLLQVGEFYCTLHLFDGLLLLHFSQPNGHGMIFGYHPRAAPNLTTFVEVILPKLKQDGLDQLGQQPSW